jgi:hypothetical protein
MGEMTSMVNMKFRYEKIQNYFIDEQIKDERLNDEKFLKMLEAMYDSDENTLAQKLLDYDYCNYQGSLFKIFIDCCTCEKLTQRAQTNVIAWLKFTSAARKKIPILSLT